MESCSVIPRKVLLAPHLDFGVTTVNGFIYPFTLFNDVCHQFRLLGTFLFSVSALANAAQIQVSSMSTWRTIQTAFHLIQCITVCAGISLIYESNKKAACVG